MPRDIQTAGPCPKCAAPVACAYNHFQRDELVIDAWEHKCPNCGHRETKAFRSDQRESWEPGSDPAVCPYCARRPA